MLSTELEAESAALSPGYMSCKESCTQNNVLLISSYMCSRESFENTARFVVLSTEATRV